MTALIVPSAPPIDSAMPMATDLWQTFLLAALCCIMLCSIVAAGCIGFFAGKHVYSGEHPPDRTAETSAAKPCEATPPPPPDTIIVTPTGKKWHKSDQCTGLKKCASTFHFSHSLSLDLSVSLFINLCPYYTYENSAYMNKYICVFKSVYSPIL